MPNILQEARRFLKKEPVAPAFSRASDVVRQLQAIEQKESTVQQKTGRSKEEKRLQHEARLRMRRQETHQEKEAQAALDKEKKEMMRRARLDKLDESGVMGGLRDLSQHSIEKHINHDIVVFHDDKLGITTVELVWGDGYYVVSDEAGGHIKEGSGVYSSVEVVIFDGGNLRVKGSKEELFFTKTHLPYKLETIVVGLAKSFCRPKVHTVASRSESSPVLDHPSEGGWM